MVVTMDYLVLIKQSVKITKDYVLVQVILDPKIQFCLLYTSDAADEEDSVDLGGRRILKKKKKNKKFKNIRSTILLKKIINKVKLKNYKINNIDINIIAQKPKISKFKNKMIHSISKICELSTDQINIKGKTTEKLGVIGKEKAIACEVITSVIKNA